MFDDVLRHIPYVSEHENVWSPRLVTVLIKNKSTASGGETPKGSAVSGVHLSHRDLGHMNGTSFGRRLWDCGTRVSAARLDEYPSRRCIHEQAKLQRDEDQGGSNFDSTQRPLQGAFLIPPVLPVVLIFSELGMVSSELRTDVTPRRPLGSRRSPPDLSTWASPSCCLARDVRGPWFTCRWALNHNACRLSPCCLLVFVNSLPTITY